MFPTGELRVTVRWRTVFSGHGREGPGVDLAHTGGEELGHRRTRRLLALLGDLRAREQAQAAWQRWKRRRLRLRFSSSG